MHLRRILSAAALPITVGLAAVPVHAQQPPGGARVDRNAKLTLDPKTRAGVLPNGLHYYVRANSYPAKRAELRLAVNAGSIVEDDDQRGMAHVIEHMGFNGTTHFKKNELVSYLQSIGVRFGADLNAYTSFDETVYMLQVPTDTARIVEQGITVLEDWAHGQLFDSTEVANERGVVVEEWRLGKGAGDRMRQQYWPIMFRGSKYADRWVVGTKESIMSSTPALLRRFYDDWYRPDLEAVIAVGDFDPAQMEALIKKHFSGIPRAKNPRPRVLADVPTNKEPLVAITTDKEAQNNVVELLFKQPQKDYTRTVGDYRRMLTNRLFSAMLNARLQEISQKPDAPFAQAFGGMGGFVRALDVFQVAALVKDGGAERGAEALITETRRADLHGFLQAELDRAKQNMLRGYERAYAERDKTQSAQIVNEYVGNYLDDEPVPGIEAEYKLAQELLPTITLQDVNTLASKVITDDNRIILVEAPQKEGEKVPTREEMLAAIARAQNAQVAAYTENVSSESLVAKLPAKGAITATRQLSAGVTEWRLSNGARVLIKPTDFKADEIRFGAYSPGGTSLVSDADYMSAALASQIMFMSGVGAFNRVDLGKKLAGKAVSLIPSIGPTTEGLSGSASPKDLETLMQLTYEQFTAPRLDTAAFAAMKNQFTAMLTNRAASPEGALVDTFSVTMGSNHPRSRPLSLATLADVSPQRAYEIFRDRFADASDFTFVFVGNVDTTALEPLVEQYLASLPTLDRRETWKDVGMHPPTGVVEKVVRKGTEPKSMTFVAFTGPIAYTQQNRIDLSALIEIARIKVVEVLREKLSGTYSPNIGLNVTRFPRPEYTIVANFSSSPENAEMLKTALFQVIDSLQQIGPSQADVEKAKEQMLRAHEVELKQNAYWYGTIITRDQTGEDFDGVVGPYDQMVKSLTAAQIQRAAKQYFNMNNYVRVVLVPEGPKPTP
ncbi:MAG TPA: insulinase family protein [Gemmatimonadaceae bacterium]|nr:insulinase family protein [Gemmatimonadaceae bacterium]